MLFKIKTKIRRFLSKFFRFHRPGCYPYLSGDGYRTLANFVYDQFLDFNPDEVTYGDIVFVRGNNLQDFFSKIHPNIKSPYVLVSGNEDSIVNSDFLRYTDEKIIHWYAQNLDFKNEGISLLPIGIGNFISGHHTFFTDGLSEFINTPAVKKDRVLFGFAIDGLIPERIEASKVLTDAKIADYMWLPRSEYFKTLSSYKFIASPRGGGLDCHRTWEAFYFKVIPIMLRNDFGEQIQELGLPILLIEKWSDVKDFTPEYLEDFYNKNKSFFDSPKLHIEYWYNEFIKYKAK